MGLCLAYLRGSCLEPSTADHLTVVHVSDPAKDPASLPFDYRATSIEEYFRTRCPVSVLLGTKVPGAHVAACALSQAHFASAAWKYVNVSRAPGLDTRASLMSYLNSPGVNPDLLVVGMVGRKGPKSEPTLIGRTSDYALREARVSSCICKLHEVPAESVFAIAVDGSDRAHLGVALVERLLRPCDRVIVVHVEVSLWRVSAASSPRPPSMGPSAHSGLARERPALAPCCHRRTTRRKWARCHSSGRRRSPRATRSCARASDTGSSTWLSSPPTGQCLTCSKRTPATG